MSPITRYVSTVTETVFFTDDSFLEPTAPEEDDSYEETTPEHPLDPSTPQGAEDSREQSYLEYSGRGW